MGSSNSLIVELNTALSHNIWSDSRMMPHHIGIRVDPPYQIDHPTIQTSGQVISIFDLLSSEP